MPNWCLNSLTLSHEDPAQIKRAVDAYADGRLLDELVPMPKELSTGEGWYDWAVGNWGTKWDVGGDGYDAVVSEDGKSANFNFDSAWSPPLAAYEIMERNGFGVHAMYYEGGMAFAGVWSDGVNDSYDCSDKSSVEIAEELPADLDECFAISETMAEWENIEPLTEWYEQGVKEKGLSK
jgi:hypothetical protein